MSDTIIQVEDLGKKYLIRHQAKERYIALRDVIARRAASIGRRLLHPKSKEKADPTREEFWALKDVSFEVKRGEVIGIIGRNGAGKSTLLKLLSRITEPTTGKIRIRGRVASLLEVGTGFHPELTGRENIYLNGAILGMHKSEIRRKFDEIVAFSEVEKFLDTPVKRYSSGMYVRLAFAIAAHLEPEILLVDEVLAVGDIRFQSKCLGKMDDVAKAGRTVLFVSHHMAAISKLCDICVLLSDGRIQKVDDTESVIAEYLFQGEPASGLVRLKVLDNQVAVINEVGVLDDHGRFSANIRANKNYSIWVKCTTTKKLDLAQIAIAILTADGYTVFVTTHTDGVETGDFTLHPGIYQAMIHMPAGFLNVGTYSLNVRIFGQLAGEGRRAHAAAMHALTFRLIETGSIASKLSDGRRGVITPVLKWEFR